mmetsp:Transcript_34516/g.44501  ORF Transcript_34516/g.44501 Transcript_34516/m.44501 type:complete len:255 (+) Transcript_34516:156-920(+)
MDTFETPTITTNSSLMTTVTTTDRTLSPSVDISAATATSTSTTNLSPSQNVITNNDDDDTIYVTLDDLASKDKLKKSYALEYYSDLTTTSLSSHCALLGLPKSGNKKVLLNRLIKYIKEKNYGNNRGSIGEIAKSQGMTAQNMKISDVNKIRKALVADLRKCLVFDKKFKHDKIKSKQMKGSYSNCNLEIFAALFPRSAGKKKVSVTLADLEVPRLGKDLRYGSRLDHIEGSISAQINDQGCITISGKYEYFGY